ncbi:PHD finger protein rhinoceros [Antennarius striatus]|uniref:PHD finger protein rhinoceros n=1 Tax=Antennarius striatus TaxID=241820 RepID=UPI0035B0A655
MKPDGVVTVSLEPVETLESNPVNEAAPAVGQVSDQAASPLEEEMPQQPAGETVQVEPQSEQSKEAPPAKTSNKTPSDSKTKVTNKATSKTKPGATSPTKTTRPNTSQTRLLNGTSKPQTNGVAKKTPPATVKKSAPTATAAPKLPAGLTTVAASKSKVGEKKATGAATNSAKPMSGSTTAAKKTPTSAANGVKTSTAGTAVKKPSAPKPTSAPATKPSSAASPKPPVSKTTRPTSGTAASSHPTTGTSRTPNTSTTKSSAATAKPATPKTSTTTTKSAASKPTSTTPSGGKPAAAQTSRTTTPVKKDITKPATSASKKQTESPLTRPSSTAKSAKPETPKSASKSEVTAKKPAASKAADTKTPIRSKTQDSKTASKDVSKTSKTSKTSTPKKPVGSSTPTPVKRGPKAANLVEPAKGIAGVAVAGAAAAATAAAVIAGPEKPEPPAEKGVVPSAAPELMPSLKEVTQDKNVEPAAEPVSAPVLEDVRESTPEPVPEPVREPTTEPIRQLTPEPVREPTPEPIRQPTPEPVREPAREPTPEPVRELTPEPVRESLREPTPEPVRQPTPEPVRQPTPEPVREPTPEPVHEPFTAPHLELLSQPSAVPVVGAEPFIEPVSNVQLSAPIDLFKCEESADHSVPSLGTTVMSPPCSPPGPVSPAREPQNASSLLEMNVQSDPWDMNQTQAPSHFASHDPISMMDLQTEEENKQQSWEPHAMAEGEYEEEEEEKENLFMPPSSALAEDTFNLTAQPHLLGSAPKDDFTPRYLVSPHEKEEEVEKADEEINEDDDFEEEEDEYEEQRRLGHQPSSVVTDMSVSLPSEELQVRSSTFGGSAGWHGDDLLSGMDSEDVSSCTSSRQHGVSDLSSTQHTAILEGTQSSDALIDSSLRGSEGDGNLMGSPNVETLANEEEEDEDEEDERVDDMDLSSERIEEHHKTFQQQEQEQEEDDEDVEMHSEGVTESCENADEDDFNEEERLDNLNLSAPLVCEPPTSAWGQTNPFSSPWAQPASMSSPSPISDHGAVESETPTLSPAQAHLDSGAPSFAPQSEAEPEQHQSAHGELKKSSHEEAHVLLDAAAVDMAAHSSSETSTPEDLRDYDSSSGVESRSDKQQTPVPASVQPDMDQDLGIHLEKGDEEEEEAETLPADEILGTGPPTAPVSAQSSPSTSGDEASDTEGEMQINEPGAAVMVGESAGFESPTATCSLPALEEDEEAAGPGEGEEDGGGTTPQSANSVASYGFDCTTSNSNAHSMAESCGKSPGIFSLENEEQLPEEAKDPSLIKELTLPSAAAAAQSEDLLGRHVDLMPLGHPGENQSSLEQHHYMLGGKGAEYNLEEADPMEPSPHLEFQESGDANDSQPPYYSTICDKTDSFLAGNV